MTFALRDERIAKHQLARNGEILGGVDPVMVQSALAMVMRDLSNA